MKLNELKSAPGTRKAAYRKGRGIGSGNGKTAGRGHKGQNSRAGGGVRPGFEGGQMPLYMKMPKIGFNNYRFAFKYAEIKVSDLECFDNGTTVTPEMLVEKKIINKIMDGVSVLGNGELTKKLDVVAERFTKTAQAKIEACGGTVKATKKSKVLVRNKPSTTEQKKVTLKNQIIAKKAAGKAKALKMNIKEV